MKKLMPVLFLSLLLLVGCSGSGPAKTITDMYKAAVDNDTETVMNILSNYEDNIILYQDDIMEELASTVFDAGGIDEMKITEVNKGNLIDEAVDGLTSEYGDNWSVVSAKMDEDYYFLWILQEIDGKHYVVSGDDFSSDEFLK